MMEKQVQFLGKTASGIFCQSLFGSAGAFEKVAGAPPFADWATGDQLRKFISGITKADRQKASYTLVNALGAGEYFGSNINSDWFGWNALTHEGEDYGYKTFLNAHAFQHHVNKDPTRAFGQPTLSLINTMMKRVELIVRLDREKAKHEGADGIITRIDRGEFPDVSMGCKVPFDVCYVCEHRSKTKEDYCVHMRPPENLRHLYGPNKILPDGRRICVKNLYPRFFDISFVFIGADKTAKVMAKLASKGSQVCLGDVCSIPRLSTEVAELTNEEVRELAHGYADRLRAAARAPEKTAASCECGCGTCGSEKTASVSNRRGVKTASQLKMGEIIKSIPAGAFSMKTLPALEKTEPDISPDVLNGLAKDHDVGSCCSTSGMMGIVLKPREFQRLVLVRMGDGELADELDSKREVFKEVPDFDDSVSVDKDLFDLSLMSALHHMLSARSAFGDLLKGRMSKVSEVKKPLPTETSIDHPLLDKISAAYNGYRRTLLKKLSQAVEVIQSDPQLRNEVLGSNLVNLFSKTASVPVLTPNSIAYVMGAHLQNRDLLSNTPVAGVIQQSLLLEGLEPA